MKKIKKQKKDNKASLKQQQQYLGDPFDNLKSVSTTLHAAPRIKFEIGTYFYCEIRCLF